MREHIIGNGIFIYIYKISHENSPEKTLLGCVVWNVFRHLSSDMLVHGAYGQVGDHVQYIGGYRWTVIEMYVNERKVWWIEDIKY